MRPIRKLSQREVDLYHLVPERDRRRTWLIRVPLLPGPYRGMTIGRVVMLAEAIEDGQPSTLLAHELVHVRQFRELGLPRFTWRYNHAFVRGLIRLRSWNAAYLAIPAEEEARRLTSVWARQNPRRNEQAKDT